MCCFTAEHFYVKLWAMLMMRQHSHECHSSTICMVANCSPNGINIFILNIVYLAVFVLFQNNNEGNIFVRTGDIQAVLWFPCACVAHTLTIDRTVQIQTDRFIRLAECLL